MGDHHVGFEHYLYLVRGTMNPGEMLQRIHRHVLEGCETCRQGWEELFDSERSALGDLLSRHSGPIPFDPTPPAETPLLQPSPYDAAFTAAARKITTAATRLNVEKARFRQELDQLLAIPPAERVEAIRRAKKRFRSPAFAHLLLEEGRERVRRSPQESLELLSLVRPVLLWAPGAHGTEWARALELRARAHIANACRVAGDLYEAERRLRDVRRELHLTPLADAAVEAELSSVEASLRVAQGRHREAAELLDRSLLVYEEQGEHENIARVLIKRASVARHLERWDAALVDLDRARSLLDREEQPFLYLCTVLGAAPILIDQERFEEAEETLSTIGEELRSGADRWSILRIWYLQGRTAFAVGNLDRAERLLVQARRGFIEQGLPHDTSNASLDLALVYLRQGRTREVRRLTREIAPIFQGCGIEGAALAALAVFQKATQTDAAALGRVAELRRFIEAARRERRRTPTQPS